MSQSFSHPLDPDLISLSVAKFSHNTSPYGTRTYTWNHISTRSDLLFVIRNARCIDEQGKQETRVIMKIAAGQEEMVPDSVPPALESMLKIHFRRRKTSSSLSISVNISILRLAQSILSR